MLARFIFALLIGACLAGGAQAQHAGHDNHRFKDAQKWAQVFDDPARDAWQKPHEVITALKLPADASVADIGAGTGDLALLIQPRMGDGGRVAAVDLSPYVGRLPGGADTRRFTTESASGATSQAAAIAASGSPTGARRAARKPRTMPVPKTSTKAA